MSLRKKTICGLSLLLAVSISGLEVKATTGGNTVSNIAVYASYPQRIYVDTPYVNQKYGNENIVVSGWALDSSGVKEVNVYLNDKFVGQAYYGISRPDVNTAFAGYTGGATSGYSYVIDSSKIDSGNYRIKVEAVGANGAKTNTYKDVVVKKTTLPTGGSIDLPAQGEKVSMGSIKVAGWAISQNGVKEIKVYLDKKYVGSATLGIQRGDIGNAFPQYPNAMNSGYSYDLSTLNLSKGNHTVRVEIIGNLGEVAATEKTFNYVGLEGLTCIDTPSNGGKIGGSSVTVSGWALNPSGIKKVNILVDGVLKGEAKIGQERLDVDKVFPGYEGGKNSGYSYELDLTGISKGTHIITAQGVGNDGAFKNWDIAVNVDKLDNLLCLDAPANGSLVQSNTITVKGWSLNNSGTKEIKVLVDGQEMASGNAGLQRLDVDKAFPGYPGGKSSGYSINVDASKLKDGSHIITVRSTGIDGTVKIVDTAINLKKPAVVKPVDPPVVPPVVVDPTMKITYKDYLNTLDYYVDRQYTGTLNVVWPGGVATKDEIKTYMNPDLYVNDPVAKYIFLKLNYISGINVSDLNNALANSGILTSKGQAFLDGGLKYNVNPIYLVSHAKHETGNGTSALAKGILVTTVDGLPVMPKVVYNMYGVGAVDSAPDQKGSEYAYKQGWFTVEDAIIGGAQFISKNYINNTVNNQNTLYKMKWDLDRVWHAYATDIGWANKTAANIKKIIDKMQNPPLQFEVPKFKK